MVSEDIARRMMRRFEGYDKAYGSYDAEAAKATVEGGKVEIKSTAYTRNIDGDHKTWFTFWMNHLDGKKPLGVIAIRDNNTCVWGAIDIDQYDIDIVKLIERVKEEELPLIACATKSGGVHLYLFMVEPVPAYLMQTRLREMAANLGYGGSEVFPKQKQLEPGRGGIWLNMPYFGATRWAYKPDGTTMPLEEFLDLADSLEQPAKFLDDEPETKRKRENYTNTNSGPMEFRDGPPCLQHLAQTGLGEGQRNNGILQFGVLAKKKFPNSWQEVLERWNRDIVNPPLPVTELADVIRRLEQKDYYYLCKDQPIVSHCNSAICRTRKFGVASGAEGNLPVISGLSMTYPADPPIWFMSVNDIIVELSTDQLMNYKMFQKVCVEKLQKQFAPMTQKAWTEVTTPFIDDVNRIEVSDEVGIDGHFAEILDEFVNQDYRANNKDGILNKKPWLDDEETVMVPNAEPGKKHFFRLKDLQKYIYTESDLKTMSRPQITTRIKNLKGGSHSFNIKGKCVGVWWVPADFADPVAPLSTSKLDRDPI